MESREAFHDAAARLADAARPIVENVVVFERVDSTHASALRLIEQAETEELVLPTTLIIAREQERGQGRAGRIWASPPGGLYLSWLAAGLDSETLSRLPMIAAAAASEAVGRLGIEGAVIKWPNDLLVAGRKIAGLLIHARHATSSWVVVSIGVNVECAPALTDGSPTATTSVAELGARGDATDWAEAIIRVFVEELAGGIAAPESSLATWRSRLLHEPGDEMVVRIGDGSEIHGTFAGLTDDGHLRLERDGEEIIIAAGDVVE
jgi:BirA family biotin operon repressor/biotin-[acetyl-CoA-carboxylase] ligase